MTDWVADEEITAAKLNTRRGFPSLVKAHTSLQLYIKSTKEEVIDYYNIEIEKAEIIKNNN